MSLLHIESDSEYSEKDVLITLSENDDDDDFNVKQVASLTSRKKDLASTSRFSSSPSSIGEKMRKKSKESSIEITDFHDSRCTTSLFVVVTSVLTIYNIGLVVAMVCLDVVHSNRYTYWNYFGQALFYFVLWIAIVFKSSYLFTLLTLYALPVVFGSVFFVQFFIILVLQLDNGEMFTSATTLDGGTASVGTVHTLDYVVHTSPVISLLALFVSGYLVEVRATVHAVQKKLNKRGECLMFFVHYLATPFLPLTLYCSIFNPFYEYPTPASPVLLFFVALLAFILFLTWFWKIVTTSRGVVTAGHFKVK
ncbi:MAG: hypothetical protein BVN35_06000 [Proteobacteria bacterium ST_bin11]|nr:MAG: hypothetical protein BVN35_06000 [Proteobacteria bacterium ST_bin11]